MGFSIISPHRRISRYPKIGLGGIEGYGTLFHALKSEIKVILCCFFFLKQNLFSISFILVTLIDELFEEITKDSEDSVSTVVSKDLFEDDV